MITRLAAGIVLSVSMHAAVPPAKPKPVVRPKLTVAETWLSRMTLRQKAAQLIIVPCFGENPNVRSADYRRFTYWVRDLQVGGLIVLNRVVYGSVRNAEPFAMASFLNQMQRMALVPLIVAADLERGASMRVANTTKFPHNMAYGAARDLAASRAEGLATARESRALGIHWIFAPVADVNNNAGNPVINIRSYGEKASDVAAHVEAYIEGAHSDPANRVLVCAKHFPGHGDTAVDSHLGLGTISGDRKRLDEVELVPFRAAIRKGVDSVMTAHLAIPSVEPEAIPATVSQAVLTGLLRKELGFQGIIVTDAMDMRGLTKIFPAGEAGVRALIAGADVLLMPANPIEVISAVIKAVETGRVSRKRLDESVIKLLNAKVRLGLHQKKFVNLESANEVLEAPETEASAQSVADHAVTLVRNDKDLFPAASTAAASCLFILTESRRNPQGLRLLDEVKSRAPEMKIVTLDPALPEAALTEAGGKAAGCRNVYVAAFASVSAYAGDTPLSGAFAPFVAKLLEGAAPVGLISLGNPYLIRSFPNVAAYLTTFSTAPASEAAAVKALFGEIPLTGRLPVTIPGIAEIGAGIQLPARSK